ncbi:23S rRNA (guanosine(2251)-2'-O)-methyltransferase RlmB [Litorivicinus lipolyticus]|uniref:23S rRNA (Guanosine(2251)-2'-O)-methyltransferase RlmB n=1 Tax=Litorivicinus lipolyticus TaxID=418701 RepID=A0A5Q2QAV3_9GAMM|nr:23S rRNA (guanosine(2251)-2'-O)-methyltransferase RlmB [Litorivicinus lipolyticus]QGG79421.1 23S rRNA (guanosine(2251)-2'-O)-methyltransferase RlmB [Litorivicinus lipolyticus]
MNESIVGWHAAMALIERSPARVQQVLVLDSLAPARFEQLQQAGVTFTALPKAQFLKQGNTYEDVAHQGIAVIASPSAALPEGALAELLGGVDTPLLLALDGVTDPRNLGAILRSAEAAGVTAVIQPKDNSAALNQAARKTACGAAELVPLVTVTNLKRTLEKLRKDGFWVSGAAGEGAIDAFKADLTGPRVIVVGSEGRGLRKGVRDACDEMVAIPMVGAISSLNVSVATGVLLFEALRQRRS